MIWRIPDFTEEENLRKRDYHLIAGIDEVGRGPLAGPVVAAAVVLPQNPGDWISSVRDSKVLSPSKREFLSKHIWEEARGVGIGAVSHKVIDEQGIVPATRLAMKLAVERLPFCPDFLLIDALSLPGLHIPQKGIIKGDSISFSIASASIVAKVYRDHLMIKLENFYPGYGFVRNKGYPTPEHLANLPHLGPSPIHRKTFAPVRKLLSKQEGFSVVVKS